MTLPSAKTALLVIAIYFLRGFSWWCVFAAAIFIFACHAWRRKTRGSS